MGDEAASILRGVGAAAGEAHQPVAQGPAVVVVQHPDAEPVRVRGRNGLRDRDHLAHPGERAVHRHVLLVRHQSAHHAVFLHRPCRRLERRRV